MTKTWRILAALGLVTSVAVVGCVVGSDDESGTGGSGGGGTGGGGTGGGGTGGGGTGGGGTGGGGTGGVAGGGGGGTGGSAGYACDPEDGASLGSTPGSCTADDPNNACQVCVEDKCCPEWSACVGTNPNDACGFGGPAGEGEIICIQSCIFDITSDGGVIDDTAIGTCANGCATAECGTISGATNDLVTCLKDSCFVECMQQ